MAGIKRTPTSLLVASILLSQVGCVALNIPSERYHDPSDSGGILGAWTGKGSHHQAHHASDPTGHLESAEQFHGASGYGGDDDCLPMDDLDDYSVGSAKPKPPKIPWPRFHPVPTRPVFGTAQLETL